MLIYKLRFSLIIVLALVLIITNSPSANAHVQDIDLYSESAILIDQSSGEVLYEKNSQQQMYPASITKIITGIIAIEQGDLDEMATISENATEVIGTSVYLLEDEEVELRKLVKGMLINSGNDASAAIAEHIAGSEEEFAELMNEFVNDVVGVSDTNFTNPHGLFDEDQYTTASDMAKITQYAMDNEKFRDIVAMTEFEWETEGWETTIYNHHQMVRQYDEVTGVKNGFVRKSGYTLVTTASHEDDQIDLVAVTLNSPSANHAYNDTRKLINYGFDNFKTNKLEEGEILFDENGQEYELEEPLYFTTKVDQKWEKEVTDEGFLSVFNDDQDVLLEKQLKTDEELDQEPDPKDAQMAMGTATQSDNGLNIVFWIALTLLATLITIVVLFIRKRRKRDWFFR
ncbi:D-alanyl-D-alanine carboxypeptidase/D-alanyl-D-alanine carboxypeptidase (penicillin-binding protein 5/6) [Alkalibacillus filiformis]|uniref:D-alanyl-D-alanine carboxypeptidase/D-alanyl-D-alanine carboxypeptidase (Penicillin-binding protein 5/6) n=1 Tax=Alkalibacillus filiformis TaxID=200990 RepID=A0ABU0DSQ4_9BACI|nr:D-alanyl-D-alanine carboxypeptidase family protein [Alkalibacillus filiformis]MDQ0351473.1 D-alanyl-D-alanine carboxypeptidase/D-alanyl-D-alanine carboxypeptidase (penicillin-binding protein 5/6) [Alkalibacillus filiformis]